jgi:orotate phosphoribosyltransferase
MSMTQDGWIKCYSEKGALWIHDGNVKRPHALLSSGKHSSGFFNSELIMEDSSLLDEACYCLAGSLAQLFHIYLVTARVVGPAMGAITLADGIARNISLASIEPCLRAYTEKEDGADGKKMVFKRTTIKPGEMILLCEDVLTTGGSVDLSAQAVLAAGGIVLPFVAVLVNRSGLSEVNGKKIVALIDKPMPVWEADECPLCKQGSEAIKPKGVENWARLNASY